MTADDALRQRFEKQYGSVAQRSSGGGKAPRYKPREDDALDPMDPAAYCDDVSRGGWGVGLDTRDDAKTGVGKYWLSLKTKGVSVVLLLERTCCIASGTYSNLVHKSNCW